MRTRSLILLVLLGTLSGCIVTYYDFPRVTVPTTPLLTKDASIPCYVSEPAEPFESDHQEMLQAMAQVGIMTVVGAPDTLPKNGRYCSVQIRQMPEKWKNPANNANTSPLIYIYMLIFPTTIRDLYTIEYDVYENRERLRTYHYEFHQNRMFWPSFLALMWFNWWTTSKEDVFTKTLLQFIQDAQRDGYLKTAK